MEGHVGAFVVSSPVAANKDKEGAFEITHLAKLIDFESQKQSKSLPEISENFARNILKQICWGRKVGLKRGWQGWKSDTEVKIIHLRRSLSQICPKLQE